MTAAPPSATTTMANRRVFDKVWEEVQRLVADYRISLTRKLKEIKGIGNQNIDSTLESIEYLPRVSVTNVVCLFPWTNLLIRYLG